MSANVVTPEKALEFEARMLHGDCVLIDSALLAEDERRHARALVIVYRHVGGAETIPGKHQVSTRLAVFNGEKAYHAQSSIILETHWEEVPA